MSSTSKISLAPLGGADRTLVVAAIRDRSQQERAISDLAQPAAIMRSSSHAIFSITAERGYHLKSGGQPLFDYQSREIIGQHITRLFPLDGSEQFDELLSAVMAARMRAPLDTQWMTKSGQPLDVAISLSPMNKRDGQLPGISVMARDFTPRKRGEVLLRRQERAQATTSEIRLSMLANSPLEDTFALICDRVHDILDDQGALIVGIEDGLHSPCGALGVLAAIGHPHLSATASYLSWRHWPGAPPSPSNSPPPGKTASTYS